MTVFHVDRRRFLLTGAAAAAGWSVANALPRIPFARASKESAVRTVKSIHRAQATMERAGVHLHRGMETITYFLAGTVEHADSLGHAGILGAGDVQWMTAGNGILHQEMPVGDAQGRMHGFQLWANHPDRRR